MPQVHDNTATRRFEMEESGHTVFADYRLSGADLYIDHVESPQALRGSGAAGRFMQGLLAEAKARKLTIIPICSYAAAWIAQHGGN